MKFDELQEQIGINFQDTYLLKKAFTHSSYVNEHRKQSFQDNERLEFLGDAVLELTVSHFLFTTFPEMSEGEMTKLRASIVCEPSLVQFAQDLDFNEYVLLGRGEERMGGRKRPALLADVFEAFVGALYIDQGLTIVEQFLAQHVYPKITDGAFSQVLDYKSQLQEWVQQDNAGELSYDIVDVKGPAHHREFVSEVYLGDESLGSGVGKSKKEAEQRAAQKAIQGLKLKV